MSNANYPLPTAGSDKAVDLEEIDFGGGVLRYRQRSVISSPTDANAHAAVLNSTPAGTEYALAVRVAGTVDLPVTLADLPARQLGVVSVTGDAATTAASGSQVDGHSATLGSTLDGDDAVTAIGLLKKIKSQLAGNLAVVPPDPLDVNIASSTSSAFTITLDGVILQTLQEMLIELRINNSMLATEYLRNGVNTMSRNDLTRSLADALRI